MGTGDGPLIRLSGEGVRREHGETRRAEAGPVKANYRVVGRSMTPSEAFRAVCAACVRHVEANRHGALAAEDPEYLHQLRVALRRLRTALEVFADAVPGEAASALLGELRWLSRALGNARDWDVFIGATLRPALVARPRHPGLRALRAASEELGAEARKAAHRALESRRYYAVMRTLRALSYADAEAAPAQKVRALPMRVRAAAVIRSMYGRARKRGRKLVRVDAAALHRLRNAVRRLRYGLLFLDPILPEARARSLAAAVEVLQETLGELNDCEVAEELVRLAHAEARGPQRRKARKLLKKRIAAARAARGADLEAQWEAFRALEKGWAPRGA
jgi:CHAD domain-containing protein